MKDSGSSSWAVYIKRLLQKYHLPSIASLLEHPPKKDTWKKMVKEEVNKTWTKQLQEESKAKSSLQYLKIEACSTSKIHIVWQDLQSPLDVRKATVKAQLLVQRYPLATNRTAGAKRAEICPLCTEEPETVTHFLLQCKALQPERTPYLRRVLTTCREKKISIHPESLTMLILDTNHLPTPDKYHEKTCRNMIFKMHSKRAILLGGVTQYKRVKK